MPKYVMKSLLCCTHLLQVSFNQPLSPTSPDTSTHSSLARTSTPGRHAASSTTSSLAAALAAGPASAVRAAAAQLGMTPLLPSSASSGLLNGLLGGASGAAALLGVGGGGSGGGSNGVLGRLVAPPSPPVAALNDILEIRTDVQPVRLISSPDRPPLVSSGVHMHQAWLIACIRAGFRGSWGC
jgi:hypothetical protein